MTQVLGGAALGAGAAAGTTQVTPIAPIPARAYETPVPPEPAWPDTGWDEDEDERSSRWRWILPLLVVLALLGALAYFLLVPRGEQVPDVVGMPLADARTELVDAGFVVGEISQRPSADQAEGTVLEQDPDGGDRADVGSEIDLVVSSGPEPVPVPDVTGIPRQRAVNLLREAGFEVREGEREPSDQNAGIVLRQNPDAGVEADPGSTVIIVVSSGPEDQQVQSVVGQSESAARSTLEGAGFVVEVETVDSSQPAGTVVRQTPPANTAAEPGSTVVLQVASGNNAVPNVVGDSREAAEQQLRDAGFTATIVTEPTTDPTQAGVVLSTDPSAGSVTRVGQSIRVVVGEAVGNGNGEPAPGNSDAAPGQGRGKGQSQR
jgi:eukaryotic-like serine/threonine-protein kinase